MVRLIDADALIDVMVKDISHWSTKTLGEALSIVPTVDAVPVVHGRWMHKGITIFCSACGMRYSDELPYMSRLSTPGSWDMEGFEYCPHCGAKMNGERRESE